MSESNDPNDPIDFEPFLVDNDRRRLGELRARIEATARVAKWNEWSRDRLAAAPPAASDDRDVELVAERYYHATHYLPVLTAAAKALNATFLAVTPNGARRWRPAHEFVETGRRIVSDRLQDAEALVAECMAILSAAARLRGVLADGAVLTDEQIYELASMVRGRKPEAETESAPGPPKGGRPLLPDGNTSSRPRRRRRFTQEQTNALVHDWLAKHAPSDPAGVTRDRIAAETGASGGNVSKAPAWVAFSDRRDAMKKPSDRAVPLTEQMLAAVPSDVARPDELAALIEEQAAEQAIENRRHKPRHKPS